MKKKGAVDNLYLVKETIVNSTFRDFVVRNTEKLKDYQSFLKNENLQSVIYSNEIFGQIKAATHRLLGKALFQPTNNRREWLWRELAVFGKSCIYQF